ncbi:MAG: hypothetical protein WB565_07700, partial [Acidimicrobiales bacterium]
MYPEAFEIASSSLGIPAGRRTPAGQGSRLRRVPAPVDEIDSHGAHHLLQLHDGGFANREVPPPDGGGT